MTTLTPIVTPQQQMALAFRDFARPEGKVVKPGQVHVWTIKAEPDEFGNPVWVEAIGRDSIDAVSNLVREVSRR